MDIDRVRYFCAFAELGSLVKASEVLGVSQPALSKALKVLEHEVGYRLVESDGRGLRLTQDGSRFLREAKPLLSQWLALPGKLERPKEQPLRIATFEVFSTHFLTPLFEKTRIPQLELHELGPGKLESVIAQGRADLGITYAPVPTQGLEFIRSGSVEMGVFGLKRGLPFVVPLQPMEGTPSKMVGLDGWPDHRIPRQIAFRVTLMESALALCRRGHAVAYLPKFIVELHNASAMRDAQLTELDCPVPANERKQDVFLVKRVSTPETNEIREIARILRSLK